MTATEPTRLLVGLLAWPAARGRCRWLATGTPVAVESRGERTCVVRLATGERYTVPAGFVAGAK